MSLKNVFNIMKAEGILIPRLDSYLLTLGDDADRGHNYVSPSSVHNCIRSQMYRILGHEKDGAINPRLRRIFDVGTATHEMLQDYFIKEGSLIIPECPIFCPELKLTGHADGIVAVKRAGEAINEAAILEIKTINNGNFIALRDAKEDHKRQACSYLYCTEELRKQCRVSSVIKFNAYRNRYLAAYEAFMDTFVTSGKKYTKEQKIAKKVAEVREVMGILRKVEKPINKMLFLYINKDNQDLKEYTVTRNEEHVAEVREICKTIDKHRIKNTLPPRPEGATGKSSDVCRYCDYKQICFK